MQIMASWNYKYLFWGLLCFFLVLGLELGLNGKVFVDDQQSAVVEQDSRYQPNGVTGTPSAVETGSRRAQVTNSRKAEVTVSKITGVQKGSKKFVAGDFKNARKTDYKKADSTDSKTTGVTGDDGRPVMDAMSNDAGTPGPPQDTGKHCSQQSRISLYKKVCAKANRLQDTEYIIDRGYLDYGRELFACLIHKAGHSSWVKFLVRNEDPTMKNGGRNQTYLKTIGLEKLYNIHLDNITEKYGSWRKYLLVRHPLQRLVSGYYQTNVHGTFIRRTFLDFIQGMVSGSLHDNVHYMRYTDHCHMCDIDYEFIAKRETSEQDMEDFKELYNLTTVEIKARPEGNMINITETSEQNYKYDEMLGNFQDEHPELMRKILDRFGFDMELFGYGWDWDRRKSYCIDKTASGCC